MFIEVVIVDKHRHYVQMNSTGKRPQEVPQIAEFCEVCGKQSSEGLAAGGSRIGCQPQPASVTTISSVRRLY